MSALRVGSEVRMPGSALRWAALNLRAAGRPAERRRLRAAAPPDGASLEAAAAEIERARSAGARIVTPDDATYPALLRASPDPPLVLYVLGDLREEDLLAVAVVGARRATPHGLGIARRLAADLAGSGFTIVSGLARGVDAAAHRGALEGGGRTIAVLGSGVDRVYPEEHRRLAESIARSGAVVSELPLGTAPLQRHFPERNRIIAWLSWATVVVEAAEDSGSLITAGLALDAGRAVFAVPGPVGEPCAAGTNALLREGALVCRSAGDVLEDLAPQIVEAARVLAPGGGMHDAGLPEGGAAPAPGDEAGGTPDQRRVLAAMPATRGIDVDRLGERAGLDAGRLAAALLDMEIRGIVRSLPGGRYVRTTSRQDRA